MSHEAIVKALFENYVSIYVIDAETSSFRLGKMIHASVDIRSIAGKGTTATITIPKENTKG